MANDNFVLLRHLKLSAMRCAAMLTSKLNELTTAFSEDLIELDEIKQDKLTNVEITQTICENIIFDDNNLIHTLPSAITLDSDAFYYIDCAYYENGVDGEVNIKYSLHTFSRVIDGVVKWASANDDKAIILNETSITNNWLDSGHTNVISIYKVKNNNINPLDIAALHSTGYKTVAPGGYNATAEGHKTVALGYGSHAEGRENRSMGDYSHTEGAYNYAYGYASHAQGCGTIATIYAQHVEGAFNVEDWETEYLHVTGNGTSDTERSNAYTLDWNGNAWFTGDVYVGSTSGLNKDEGSKKLATEEYVDNATANIDPSTKVSKSGDTMTGALVAQNNTNYTTKQVRNIILVADGEEIPAGANGDICLVYAP